MPIDLSSFLKITDPTDEVQKLLLTIFQIQAQFEADDERDIVFQQSKSAHAEILNLSKKKYAVLAEAVNYASLEQLSATMQSIKSEIKQFNDEHEMNSITGHGINALNSKLENFKTVLTAKEKYGTLKPFDDLVQDKTALQEIFSNHKMP